MILTCSCFTNFTLPINSAGAEQHFSQLKLIMDRSFGLDYDPRQFPNEVYYNEVIDNFGKMIHTQKAVVIGLCRGLYYYQFSIPIRPTFPKIYVSRSF